MEAFYTSGPRATIYREIPRKRVLERSRVATEHNGYKNLVDFDVCREFGMFEVKVPVIFFDTEGFSAHRDGRYFNFLVKQDHD